MPSENVESLSSTSSGTVTLTVGRFFCKISKAKKTPEIRALNPAETPVSAPAHNSSQFRLKIDAASTPFSFRRNPKGFLDMHKRLKDIPTLTLGPSSPRLHPVPNVNMAASVFCTNFKLFRESTPLIYDFDCCNAIDKYLESISFIDPRSPGGKSPNDASQLTPRPPMAGINHSGTLSE